MNIVAGFTLAVALMTTVVHAQSRIAGKWQGTTSNGMDVVLDLKVADEKLTGTVTRAGTPSTITEGKVTKNTLTFTAILGEQTEKLTGEINGEQLKVWLDRQGPEGAVIFKRATE